MRSQFYKMLVFERTVMLKMFTAFQISSPKLLCSTNDSKRKAQKAMKLQLLLS